MTFCPSDEKLTGLLADALSSQERDLVARHVEGCASCQEQLAHLTDTALRETWRRAEDPHRASGTTQGQELMLSLEAREDLARKLEEAFDLELLEAAKVQVRLRVAPHTWEAFRLLALEGLPVAEVAARVRLQVAMVYVAKSKVQKMLREEIGKLEMGL